MSKNLYIGSSIDSDTLIDHLCSQFDHDELVEFVKELDSSVADLDFANKLISYFESQKIVYKEEAAPKPEGPISLCETCYNDCKKPGVSVCANHIKSKPTSSSGNFCSTFDAIKAIDRLRG